MTDDALPSAEEASNTDDALPSAEEASNTDDALPPAEEASNTDDALPCAEEASNTDDALPCAEEASSRRDRGSAAIEMAILAPAVIAVFVTLMIAGRTVIANQSIEAAAFDAARTASLSRDSGAAHVEAKDAAEKAIARQGLTCARVDVRIDTSQFARAIGEPASVTVTVECDVNFKDIALPGMPGSTTLTATFTSPLDRYRTRS